MALDHLSPRATFGGSADAARFALPDLIGFAAYAIAVGGGQPALDFFLSAVLGTDAPPDREVEESALLSGATDSTTATPSPDQDQAPQLAPAAAPGTELQLSSQIESWRPLVARPAAVQVGVS